MRKSGPPAWGLGKGITTPHCKQPTCYKMLQSMDLRATE